MELEQAYQIGKGIYLEIVNCPNYMHIKTKQKTQKSILMLWQISQDNSIDKMI